MLQLLIIGAVGLCFHGTYRSTVSATEVYGEIATAAAACPDLTLPANARITGRSRKDNATIVECGFGITVHLRCVNGRWQDLDSLRRCGQPISECPDLTLPANTRRVESQRDDVLIVRCVNVDRTRYLRCIDGRWDDLDYLRECGNASEVVEPACTTTQIDNCTEGVENIAPSPQLFNTHCRKVERALSCLERNPCPPSSNLRNYNMWLMAVGRIDAKNYLCSRRNRQHTHSLLMTCIQARSSGQPPRCEFESKDTLQPGSNETCRELSRMVDCLHEPYKTFCSAEAADLFLTFLQKQFGRYGCSFGGGSRSVNGESKAWMTSLMLLPVVFLTHR